MNLICLMPYFPLFFFQAGNLCIEANFEHVFDAYAFGILAEEFLEQLQELGLYLFSFL